MRFESLAKLFLAFCFLQVLLSTQAAFAVSRVALVIGNSNYENIQSLANPENDAQLMADTLTEAGFEVRKLIDADYREMKKELLEFGRILRNSDVEAGLIYYAGHGVQVRGENYLIPINATLADEDEVDLEGINVNDFLRVMNSSNSPVNIVVLDACRNNPFKGAFRSATRGLAPVDAPMGTLIAYATSPGQVALDGVTDNSPYTAALSRAIVDSAGEPIESVFKQARRNVLQETDDKQVPWEVSSITGDFYFYPEEEEEVQPSASSPSVSTSDLDVAYWSAVRDDPTAAELRAYLEKFPNGLFAAVAKKRLSALESKPQQQASLTPSTTLSATPDTPQDTRPVPTDPKELARSVQVELNRLGCNAGSPDGIWGRGSRSAATLFERHSNLTLASVEPTADFLRQLREIETRVCPLVCRATENKVGNACVTKTCPAGKKLSSKGVCYTPKRTTTQTTRPASSGGSNCFVFNGEQFCD
jgi:uncharacterized caspase-like protein